MKRMIRIIFLLTVLAAGGYNSVYGWEPFVFIQMADPQIGRINRTGTNPADLSPDSILFSRAIDHANRLKPTFVVICGDFVDDVSNTHQVKVFNEIKDRLSPDISLYLVAGNHDALSNPTAYSLSRYRSLWGADRYAFTVENTGFIILNSCLMMSPDNVLQEYQQQYAFLQAELDSAGTRQNGHIFVFQHHPFFLTSFSEAELPSETLSKATRQKYFGLFANYNVKAVLAGHLHQNSYAEYNGIKMITSSAVGRQSGSDESGFRIVTVFPDSWSHQYYSLDEVPDTIAVGAVSTQVPYGDTAAVVPGMIEAENFDLGGEGVAYHDLTAENQGGVYRTAEGVDVEALAGGGYCLGFVKAGEWTEYTVDVAAAGVYDIDLRAANAGDGGKMHIAFNGVNKTGTINVPNTGSWTAFQTATVTGVSLNAGTQVMRVSFDQASDAGGAGVLNFDYITITGSGTTSLEPVTGGNVLSGVRVSGKTRLYDIRGKRIMNTGTAPSGIYLRETGGTVMKIYLVK